MSSKKRGTPAIAPLIRPSTAGMASLDTRPTHTPDITINSPQQNLPTPNFATRAVRKVSLGAIKAKLLFRKPAPVHTPSKKTQRRLSMFQDFVFGYRYRIDLGISRAVLSKESKDYVTDDGSPPSDEEEARIAQVAEGMLD